MSEKTQRNSTAYQKPTITTLDAAAVVEALGPVSAGSGREGCGPMLANFCLGGP